MRSDLQRSDLQPNMNNSDAFASQSASVAGLTDQIVPTIPYGTFKIVQGWNPVSSAFGLHLDSALVNPVHEHKIVRQSVVVCRTFAAKSGVSKSGGNPDPLLCFLAKQPSSL
jgi:hypothetical protein